MLEARAGVLEARAGVWEAILALWPFGRRRCVDCGVPHRDSRCFDCAFSESWRRFDEDRSPRATLDRELEAHRKLVDGVIGLEEYKAAETDEVVRTPLPGRGREVLL